MPVGPPRFAGILTLPGTDGSRVRVSQQETYGTQAFALVNAAPLKSTVNFENGMEAAAPKAAVANVVGADSGTPEKPKE